MNIPWTSRCLCVASLSRASLFVEFSLRRANYSVVLKKNLYLQYENHPLGLSFITINELQTSVVCQPKSQTILLYCLKGKTIESFFPLWAE